MQRWQVMNVVSFIMAKVFFLCLYLQVIFALLTYARQEFRTKDQQLIDSLQQYEFVDPKLSEPLTAQLTNESPAEETRLLSFNFQEQTVNIRLTLNSDLFSPNFHERYVTENGYDIRNRNPRNCYYYGVVEEESNSIAAMSTCNGIEGTFTLNGKTHLIQPVQSLKGEKLHIVFEPEELPEHNCAHNPHNEDVFLHKNIEENIESHRVRRDILSETRYIELVIVNSKSQYDKHGNDTSNRAITAVNYADTTYRARNIRVALVMMETWTANERITLSTSSLDAALNTFTEYKKNVLDKNDTTKHDHAMLITQHVLPENRMGYAGIATICGLRSTSLLYDKYGSISISAAIMAHEMGHSLGLKHISGIDKCPCGKSYCLMSASVSYGPLLFSNCTDVALKAIWLRNYGVCLFNKPKDHYREAQCGNGWIDADEECDCGSAKDCAAKPAGQCCNPSTCRLYPHSQCAEGPCCKNCTIQAQGVMCRDKVNDCDLPEYCDGKNSLCPADSYVHNGRPCSIGEENSLCYLGVCHTYDNQCKIFWGSAAVVPKANCYSRLNVRGDKYGYCKNYGNDNYTKCASKDVKCGKLQCEIDTWQAHYPIVGHAGPSLLHGTCWSATSYLGIDLPLAGSVEPGSMCAENKICYDNVCTDVNEVYKQPVCPSNCSGNGICNNLGHCHCNYGYGCETCEEKCNSTGGSIDSGNNCYCPSLLTTTSEPEQVSTKTTEEERITKTTEEERTTRVHEGSGDKGMSKGTEDVVKIVVPVVFGVFLIICLLVCYIFRATILQKVRNVRRSRNPFPARKPNNYRVAYQNQVGDDVAGTAEKTKYDGEFLSFAPPHVNGEGNVSHDPKIASHLATSPSYSNMNKITPQPSPIIDRPAQPEITNAQNISEHQGVSTLL